MSTLSRAIAILAVFCLALEIRASDLKTTSKKCDFKDKVVCIDEVGIQGTCLMYAVCDDAEERHEIKCKVGRLSTIQNQDKTCDITLKAEGDNAEVSVSSIKVTLLNEHKAVLQWKDENDKSAKHWARVNIVDFDSCHTSEVKVPVGLEDEENIFIGSFAQSIFHVVPYKDTFDLIFRNSKWCGNHYCKATFDTEGKKISEPVSWHPKVWEEILVTPVEPHSSSKGLAMAKLDVKTNHMDVSVVDSKGLRVLKEDKIENWLVHGWDLTGTASHDRLGWCSWMNSTLTCTQCDVNGRHKLENKMNVGYHVVKASIGNIPNGGYLVLTVGCKKFTDDCKCPEGNDQYIVTKIDADGTRVGNLMITDFKCLAKGDDIRMKFFEHDSKEWCFSMACSRKRNNEQHLEFVSKCFSDTDFKN